MKKQIAGKALVSFLLLGISAFLLKWDVITFWIWWMLLGLLGMIFMPVTGRIFSRFQDKGWMFSKVLAVAVCGYLTWLLVSLKILKFTSPVCIAVTVACAVVCVILFFREEKKGIRVYPQGQAEFIFWEEVGFYLLFLMWTYFAGFRPEAYGTEKFMDYGFMEAMMRAAELPAVDLWYSQGTINYYYGGQYFAVFLTKLTGTQVELTYNLMRTMVAGFAFILPFSLVYQLFSEKQKDFTGLTGMEKERRICRTFPAIAGILAGASVSLAGNMHYIIYDKIYPWIREAFSIEGEYTDYWFPDSTRYIGHNPDVPDKTIHEFPSYSFVLGDLHAHVVNIIFVLLLLGILYGWMQQVRAKHLPEEETMGRSFWKRELLWPQILAAAVLLGIYQWTNYWDFVIYFVVTGGVVLFNNMIRFRKSRKKILLTTAAQAVEVLGISAIVILPFSLQFETMVQGVALAQYHSRFYQLCILWGLPVLVVGVFLCSLLWRGRKWKPLVYLESLALPDLFVAVLGLCAVGLVLIPELVYVRDIYEDGNARANTMFKLTYQAYILFGISMGYLLMRMLVFSARKVSRAFALASLMCLLSTMGYLGNAVYSWFGEVWDPSQYQGLNATGFLESEFSQDAKAIRWLKENVQGSPVTLEANGDSYTGYERVSAMTGLPTILGWYVHEWLWRNDVEDLNEKSWEIETIYTSDDSEEVETLLEKYQVEYIFVGAMEREKYGVSLNDSLLQSLGTIVFQDEDTGTYIIETA